MNYKLPLTYKTAQNIRETEIAIKQIKDHFEEVLAKKLNLTRVSAPLFVLENTGVNDNLNGIERPVSFDIKDVSGANVEIIHSLAKWKRIALKRYLFKSGEGLYTDMNAIRRDEELDNLHSIYVDQWDWEKIISKEDRNKNTLEQTVKNIFEVFKDTEAYITKKYPCLEKFLPDDITFITTSKLLSLYPDLSQKEREDAICKKYGAVFLMEIGGLLANGEKHDGRAPDYDDWTLNGDILFWYPVLDRAVEVSSMGIRVDEIKMLEQLKEAKCEDRVNLQFHKDVLNKNLPYSIGGGIGQSRICMFFLGKAHIGEVQSSIWTDEIKEYCAESNINLL